MSKKRKPRTTFSLAIKRKGRFVPRPTLSEKQQRDIVLGKKKTPRLYVVKKRGKKVVGSQAV